YHPERERRERHEGREPRVPPHVADSEAVRGAAAERDADRSRDAADPAERGAHLGDGHPVYTEQELRAPREHRVAEQRLAAGRREQEAERALAEQRREHHAQRGHLAGLRAGRGTRRLFDGSEQEQRERDPERSTREERRAPVEVIADPSAT